ncbi:MAG: Na+/H+ antiporter subunit E [Planctomycetota bacterium]
MRYGVWLGLTLAAVWLLWSGYFILQPLILGAASVLLVLWIALRMRIVDREGVPLDLLARLPLYVPWLMWEIVKANIDVTRRILSPRLPISPRVIEIDSSQRRDLARVIYANSITLTPGTVTIDVRGRHFTVHALTKEAADGVLTGDMDRRCTRLEGPSRES